MRENESILYKLRRVDENDMELLFEWANDEDVRNNSINTNEILLDEHKAWFNKNIRSPKYQMYILEYDNVPVGQLRFQYNSDDNEWEIGYSISKKYRGLGLSRILLSEAIRSLNKFPVVGYVKIDNERSASIFKSLGFVNDGISKIKDFTLVKYIKESAC